MSAAPVMNKPILCVDFDGVLHSYSSGWKGATTIPDPPVPGALKDFRVAVYSSRSHQWLGRRAMKGWLYDHLFKLGMSENPPLWWLLRIAETSMSEPWNHDARHAALLVVREIEWPNHKPPAHATIDDRALTFDGDWKGPRWDVARLLAFRPWNKGGEAAAVGPWKPIATLDMSRADFVLARTRDRQPMIWAPYLLEMAMAPNVPEHLSFPAVEWMEIPA